MSNLWWFLKEFWKYAWRILLFVFVMLWIGMGRMPLARAGELNYAVTCLALTAYTEQNARQYEGMLLVAHTVMNRARDSRWPDDICAVVEQPHQFSGITAWKHPRRPEGRKWQLALRAAETVATMEYELPAPCVSETPILWFHATYVRPAWSKKLHPVCTVDGHIFYTDQRRKTT